MHRLGAVVLAMWIAMPGCSSDADKECAVGSEGCQCTAGGACDPGLQCVSNVCLNSNKKPAGAKCASDSECQSGQCKETVVEEQTVKQCAATTTKEDGGGTKKDGGGAPAGLCKDGKRYLKYRCNPEKKDFGYTGPLMREYKIDICENGVWKEFVNCTDYTKSGAPCRCSWIVWGEDYDKNAPPVIGCEFSHETCKAPTYANPPESKW